MLQNKVVLVTGATGGIGSAICRQAAQYGAQIALGYRTQNAQSLLEELSKTPNHTDAQHIMLRLDVTSEESVQAAVKQVQSTYGRLDGLVNNAGLTKDNLLLRMSEADFMAPIHTNLRGAFLCSKAALRPMLKARAGSIVNISSVIGHRGNAGQANYAASKAGIEALTKSLAQEVGPRNIRVNALAPGFIDTAMTQNLSAEVKQSYLKAIALARFAKPQEVAEAVCFLLSDKASYITGSTLHINGGLYT